MQISQCGDCSAKTNTMSLYKRCALFAITEFRHTSGLSLPTVLMAGCFIVYRTNCFVDRLRDSVLNVDSLHTVEKWVCLKCSNQQSDVFPIELSTCHFISHCHPSISNDHPSEPLQLKMVGDLFPQQLAPKQRSPGSAQHFYASHRAEQWQDVNCIMQYTFLCTRYVSLLHYRGTVFFGFT